MEKRIDELEQKFLYQEHLLEELNEVVTKQQIEIDSLNLKIEKLKQAQEESQIKNSKDETPPPHY